ncbi:MAG: TonB family protein [Myxococcota bacterium]|nr:TonB family protein [Myxococcota bacterium]MDW8360791.1 TonB family protein [Myxococcales bacterium]
MLALVLGASTLASCIVRAQSGELVPPRALEVPDVRLPPDADPLPADGFVELAVTIDATGTVTEATVLAPLRPDVDARAMEAALRARFAPAMRDGRPVPSRVRLRLRVVAEAREPPPPDVRADPQDRGEPSDAARPVASAEERAVDGRATESGSQGVPVAPTLVVEPIESAAPQFGARARVRRPEPGAATRLTLEGAELTSVPGTFGEPLRVVATLPGVARTPFGLGYFFVRGASFDNTGFFVDGFPVPILYHLGAGPAVISSRLVTELDFYPGGYPVRLGRFGAGVIAIQTDAPPVRGLHAEGEVDLFRASVLLAAPLGDRGSAAIAARRSYYELLLPLLLDGVDLSFGDWQLRARHRIGTRLEASLFVFGSDDRLDVTQAAGAGVSEEQVRTGVGYAFQRAHGRLLARLGGGATLAWSGAVGRDESDLLQREPGGIDVRALVEAVTLGQRLDLVVPWTERARSSAGLDVWAARYRLFSTFPTPPGLGEFPQPRVAGTTTSALTVYATQLGAAGYVEHVHGLGPVELTGGLRVDHYRYAEVSTVELDPRGVLRLRLTDAVTVKAATGLFSQPPQPFQIATSFGNDVARPMRAWQSSGGVEARLPLDVEIESQLFYSRMFRLPRTTNRLRVEDGMLRRQAFVDDGMGRAWGWELLVRRRLERGLYGWLSYTLSWSERFLEGGRVVPFFFDQRHTLHLAASYAVAGWRVGARFSLSTGRPDRPVLGAEYDADRDGFDSLRGGLTGRLPTFHQLDLRVDRDLRLGPLTGSVYLDVINVYWADNAEGWIYSYDFRQRAPLPGLPLLATVGLRLEWSAEAEARRDP